MEHFQPNAIVLCCGADSLSGDRVGCWNMSIRGHAACLEHVKCATPPLQPLPPSARPPPSGRLACAAPPSAHTSAAPPRSL